MPAVLELAAGWPVSAGGSGELATPTGVALVTTLARACGPAAGDDGAARRASGPAAATPTAGPTSSGPSLGTAVPGERPVDVETVIETNVDDLDPRAWPAVLDTLLDAGARDAWLTPILMKKGRPAHTLHVLAAAADADALRALVVEHTSAIGTRSHAVAKDALTRTWRSVEVAGEQVRVKIAARDGRIVQVTAEYEDAAAVATRLGRPVAQVLADADRAAAAAGLRAGATAP